MTSPTFRKMRQREWGDEAARAAEKLPSSIRAAAYRICKDEEFLRQIGVRAGWYRVDVAEIKKPSSERYYLSKQDALEQIDRYIDAHETIASAGDWMGDVFMSIHIQCMKEFEQHACVMVVETASEGSARTLEVPIELRDEERIAGNAMRRVREAAKRVRNDVKRSYRSRSLAKARRDFMYLMADLFRRYDVAIPRSESAREILLCQDIARWAGDDKASAREFVKALTPKA